MKSKKGFTLIELLVVVAIVLVLVLVVFVVMNNAQVKAKVSATKTTLDTIKAGATVCVMGGGQLLNPPTATQDGGGAPICNGSSTLWSKLPKGWIYSTNVLSDPQASTFSFSASGDSRTVLCDQDGCKDQ